MAHRDLRDVSLSEGERHTKRPRAITVCHAGRDKALPVHWMMDSELGRCLSDTLNPDPNIRIKAELRINELFQYSGLNL